jgi:hypothetical protein
MLLFGSIVRGTQLEEPYHNDSTKSRFLWAIFVGKGLFLTQHRWAIWIFALMVAFSQLGIAPQFMNILFTGIVAMLALAGGLAFGLGGKDAAGEFIREVRSEIKMGKKG